MPSTWKSMVFAALAAGGPAYAGPPFRTDDPQPVDPGHLELYLFAAGQQAQGARSGVGPAVEFNYGLLPDTQIHLIVPRAYDAGRTGAGDTELGVKYRFLHETDTLPQVGSFPLIVLPTARAGLGSGHTQVYLPVWVQKSWGPWTTYGGAGWWRSPGTGNRNWTYAGWLAQRDLGEKLTLGAEAFHTTAATVAGQASGGFNAGGQVNLSERHHLLFSAGRTVSGERSSFFYLGYQFTAGGFGTLGSWLHGTPKVPPSE